MRGLGSAVSASWIVGVAGGAGSFPSVANGRSGGPPNGVRYNARASVIVYTGEHPIANALGWFWIRLIAVLTYVS